LDLPGLDSRITTIQTRVTLRLATH